MKARLWRAAVERALELDDGLVAAHATMSWIKLYHDWDWQGADEAIQRALALEPGNAEALSGSGLLASVLGRLDEGLELNRRAVKLDPLHLGNRVLLGWQLISVGQLDEAAASFRGVLELDPQLPQPHAVLGLIFLLQNEPQMALVEMKRESDPMIRELGVALALFDLGRKAEADQALAVFIEEHNQSWASAIALIYAWRGDVDQAFRWLDTAYEQRDRDLVNIPLNPLWANLRPDPRWPAFLDRMGLPH